MGLEQTLELYQPIASQHGRDNYLIIGALEYLSASALYSGKITVPKIGMTLPGGLKIKNLTKESIVLQEDFGGVGNIYTAHPNGNGSTRFYGPKRTNGSRSIDKKLW